MPSAGTPIGARGGTTEWNSVGTRGVTVISTGLPSRSTVSCDAFAGERRRAACRSLQRVGLPIGERLGGRPSDLAVDGGDHVADLEAGLGGRAVRLASAVIGPIFITRPSASSGRAGTSNVSSSASALCRGRLCRFGRDARP